jgi:hypothetical protein
MNIKIFKSTVYDCGCGYTTLNQGNYAKHKKVNCGHQVSVSTERFVLERDHKTAIEKTATSPTNEDSEETDYTTMKTSVLDEEREQNTRIVSQLNNTIQNLRNSLEAMNGKVRRAIAKMSKSAYTDEIEDELYDMIKDGIIYFITDKDIPDRGKIGRTVNTDIRRLRSRYSIFGNPDVLCYFSSDINADENVLKRMMRDAGCMESNREIISNVSLAREVFYEFVEMTR